MFKTILATATAALIATAVAAPAHADGTWWGKMPNGVSANGINLQGVSLHSGVFVLDGIELPGQAR
jgi:hypothetical protein